MKTYAPSATNRFAVARPMPLLPPVTSATLPSSFPLIVIAPYLVVSNGIRLVKPLTQFRAPRKPAHALQYSRAVQRWAGCSGHRTRCSEAEFKHGREIDFEFA